MKYLSRHPKSGVLRYRRVFQPESLRAFIPRSPVQFTRSLRAREITEPGAHQRFNAAAAEYEKIVKAASLAAELDAKVSAAGFTPLSDGLIDFLVATAAADDADMMDEVRFVREPSARKYQRADTMRSHAEADLSWAKRARGAGDYDMMLKTWRDHIISAALAEGIAIDPETEEFERLVRAYHDAQIAQWERVLLQASGETVPALVRPQRPEFKSEVSRSFAAIAEAISADAVTAYSGAMRQKASTAIRLWREAHGEMAPLAIRKAHVTDFIDLLHKRPAALPKQERTMPLRELAALYEGRDDVPRISRTTIVTHLLTLAGLWSHAADRGALGDDDVERPNPFAGRKVAKKAAPEAPEDISKAEIEAMFSLPIFTAGERPTQGRGEAAYWLPLLLLWTGARPEEVAQLRLQDFSRDQASGRVLVSITNLGEHEHKGKMRLKTDKTATGRREFPVPQALLALGLETYLAWLGDRGETVLFPRLRAKGQRGNLFDSFGRWFIPMLKEKGVIPKGPRRPLRELRHHWNTEGRRVGIPREAREYLMGHSTQAEGTSSNEIYGSRSPLGRYIDDITFAGLNLSMIVRWEAPSSGLAGK